MMLSADLKARAMSVSVGFAVATVGKLPLPTTHMFWHVVRALARIHYGLVRIGTHAMRSDDVPRAEVVIVLSAVSEIARRADAGLSKLLRAHLL